MFLDLGLPQEGFPTGTANTLSGHVLWTRPPVQGATNAGKIDSDASDPRPGLGVLNLSAHVGWPVDLMTFQCLLPPHSTSRARVRLLRICWSSELTLPCRSFTWLRALLLRNVRPQPFCSSVCRAAAASTLSSEASFNAWARCSSSPNLSLSTLSSSVRACCAPCSALAAPAFSCATSLSTDLKCADTFCSSLRSLSDAADALEASSTHLLRLLTRSSQCALSRRTSAASCSSSMFRRCSSGASGACDSASSIACNWCFKDAAFDHS
mmetsp:Transcript_120514/g.239877  ORF Transcript_120514/g.239877 Transcript_120514/m.239877 type:complete len:267 (-) Transcript_120514:506-1306(-)